MARRIIVAQPGDVLVLSGVGQLPAASAAQIHTLLDQVNIDAAIFADQVDTATAADWQVTNLREHHQLQ